MGDILLAIPTIRAMQQKDTEVHLLIHQRWHELSEFLPATVHLFKGATTMPTLIKKLQKHEFASIHDLQGKLATIAISLILKAPIKTRYIKRQLSEQFSALKGNFPLKFSDQRPVWQKYAESCRISIEKPDPAISFSHEYLQQSNELLNNYNLAEREFFAVHADASKPGKVLPIELINELRRQSQKQLVLIGTGTSPVENGNDLLDLRNQLSLRQLPGFLKMAAGLISSDSGPMHLGRAVNLPLVGIFLQTSPSLGFAPVPGPKVMVISNELPCKPCSLHGQREVCPKNSFACRDFDFAKTASEIIDFFRNNS